MKKEIIKFITPNVWPILAGLVVSLTLGVVYLAREGKLFVEQTGNTDSTSTVDVTLAPTSVSAESVTPTQAPASDKTPAETTTPSATVVGEPEDD